MTFKQSANQQYDESYKPPSNFKHAGVKLKFKNK